MYGRVYLKIYKQCHTLKSFGVYTRNKSIIPRLLSTSGIFSDEMDKNINLAHPTGYSEVYDGESYFQHRCKFVESSKLGGNTPYAYNFSVSHSHEDILNKYNKLLPEEVSLDKVTVAGRVLTIRKHSKKLWFLDIQREGQTIQIVCTARFYDSSSSMEEECCDAVVGNIIEVCGSPYRTSTGELSVRATKLQTLTPCLRLLPSLHHGLIDQQTRQRQRYLDLIFNSSSRKTFITRSKIIKYLRQYLDSKGFTEVETPMLNAVASGAAAKPFKTLHSSLQQEFFLRVAPELYLKMLIVGGLDKVFEIGRVFRNEGLSEKHSSEFTCCEFYSAYADYKDLLVLTENLISNLVYHLFGSYEIERDIPGSDEKTLVNFKPPFKRIEFVPALEAALDTKLPDIGDLNNSEARDFLIQICVKHGIKYEPGSPSTKLLDKLFTRFVAEEKFFNPTFVLDHPLVMSPLAKSHRLNPSLSERFELYIAGMEICNAYTELNDPLEQRQRFQQQLQERAVGNEEAVMHDEEFCTALEYGMPPTAGWGIGLDRLAMILTNSQNIKNVILFPSMRPTQKISKKS